MTTSFEKFYVGKGKPAKHVAQIISLTFSTETLKDALEKFHYEFEGKDLLTIEVAPMKQPDMHGRTHTAYVTYRQNKKRGRPKN
jgi:hypothetical protein